MKNSGNILVGILGAAAAGVIIGTILAPQKSKKFKRNITDSADDVLKKLGDVVAQGKEKYEELKSIMSEQCENLQIARDKIADFKMKKG